MPPMPMMPRGREWCPRSRDPTRTRVVAARWLQGSVIVDGSLRFRAEVVSTRSLPAALSLHCAPLCTLFSLSPTANYTVYSHSAVPLPVPCAARLHHNSRTRLCPLVPPPNLAPLRTPPHINILPHIPVSSNPKPAKSSIHHPLHTDCAIHAWHSNPPASILSDLGGVSLPFPNGFS